MIYYLPYINTWLILGFAFSIISLVVFRLKNESYISFKDKRNFVFGVLLGPLTGFVYYLNLKGRISL